MVTSFQLTDFELKKVRLLYEKLRQWELLNVEKRNSHLNDLRQSLLNLSHENNKILQKMAPLGRHLQAQMDPQELENPLVPFERLLGRNLADNDFFITEKDHPSSERKSPLPVVLILDHLRSAFNVGSLFRTAECLCIEEIHLCGYTPSPIEGKTSKTSMGTDQWVPWKKYLQTEESIKELLSKNYEIVAFETSPQAKNWDEPYSLKPIAILLGNERFGINPQILNTAHEVRKLPTRGAKNSLNVGVSGGIVLYEWYRQWNSIHSMK